jgi:hypothetical protein
MAHLTRTLSTVLTLGLAAAPAYARQPPPAPPSGIVVHLFGPDSLSSHILPSAAEAMPAGRATTGSTPASGQTAAQGTNAASTPSGPTWGDVAHQMFVTGDPAEEGAAVLPKGKAATQ